MAGHTDTAAFAEPEYSTLEVDPTRWMEHDSNSAPIVQKDPKEDKIIAYDDVSKEVVPNSGAGAPQQRKILGLPTRTFFILLAVLLILVTAAAVGGGVGGSVAARNKHKNDAAAVAQNSPSPTVPQGTTSTRTLYANTGLAAMQYTDRSGVLHQRLYYQDNSNKVRESAWDNNTAFDSAWKVNTISDAVKPGTPIAAAAGYPHASYNYTSVKNVYYMAATNQLVERQALSNGSGQAWEDDNFSGLYTGSNSTFFAAYWNQNIQNVSQELVVLFQSASFENGITQGRYTSNSTTSNPWVANNFGFSQPKGFAFTMALISYRSGKHLMLYTVDSSKQLQQHEYTISDTEFNPQAVVALTSESPTGLTVEPRTPLTVVAQNNLPLYATASVPECTANTPLTNLILFATADRSSLVLNAWNCSAGFANHIDEIKPLQKVNTTYLSLASMSDRSTGDANVYIMFDAGNGPQVEEWTVPTYAGDPWVKSRNVTVDFGL